MVARHDTALRNVLERMLCVLCIVLLECIGAHEWPLSKLQREELKSFCEEASAREIFERIGEDSEIHAHGPTQRQMFLLDELVRRDTSDARKYIEEIFAPSLKPVPAGSVPRTVNPLVFSAMLSLAELESRGDDEECMRRYKSLLGLHLEWKKDSLDGLHEMMGRRLSMMTSRASFEFLQEYRWHESDAFRPALLHRVMSGLTPSEQIAYLKYDVLNNRERYVVKPTAASSTYLPAEFAYFQQIAEHNFYLRILLSDEYDSCLATLESESEPRVTYIRLLKMVLESLEHRTEFTAFYRRVEILYRAGDLRGLLELGVKTDRLYFKGVIYEAYVRLKLNQLSVNPQSQIAYLLESTVLRGERAESIHTTEEQAAFPFPESRTVLEARAHGLILEYGVVARSAIENALRKVESSANPSSREIKELRRFLHTVDVKFEARARVIAWGAIPEEILEGSA